MVNSRATMSNTKLGEWFWRFLAVVMMFAVGWTIWIIYQLNPPPLVMNAAFEAAAKAKGKGTRGEKQSAQGVIAPSAAAESVSKAPETPPINPDKLKFSDSITLPDPNAKK